MNIKYSLTSALAAAALFGSILAPKALAVVEELPGDGGVGGLVIADNGANSENKIKVNINSNCTLKQKSNTNANIGISITSNTGGNKVSGNTDGDNSLTTGAVSNTVTTTVTGGSNEATDPCSCLCEDNGGLAAAIIGNGESSDNKIKVYENKNAYIKQKSNTNANIGVSLKSKTGKNKVKNNTGGSNTVTTGAVSNTVTASVTGGSNTLNP